MSTPLEDLNAANLDYHKAVNKIFRDNDFIADVELRVETKALFGVQVAQVFHHMEMTKDTIKQYYGVV